MDSWGRRGARDSGVVAVGFAFGAPFSAPVTLILSPALGPGSATEGEGKARPCGRLVRARARGLNTRVRARWAWVGSRELRTCTVHGRGTLCVPGARARRAWVRVQVCVHTRVEPGSRAVCPHQWPVVLGTLRVRLCMDARSYAHA